MGKRANTIGLERQSVSQLADKADAKRASILVIALWSICFLASLAIIISFNVRENATLVQRLDDRQMLRLVADAGIKSAIVALKKEEYKGFDSLNDSWSNNPELFADVKVADGTYTICYNYINPESTQPQIRYGLIDEESKININSAGAPTLEKLFKVVLGLDEKDAQQIAAAIIDWRDKDSSSSIPSGSAEDRYYASLSYPYEAKDSVFQILDELLLVKGVSNDIYNKTKKYLTVYGSGQVNINTACEEVLLALGLDEKAVYQIMYYRNGKDQMPGTDDDNIFDSPSDIVPRLSQAFNLSASEVARINAISNLNLATSSSTFLVRCSAVLTKGNIRSLTECVIDKKGNIYYWHEN